MTVKKTNAATFIEIKNTGKLGPISLANQNSVEQKNVDNARREIKTG